MESIKDILIRRDGMTSSQAEEMIQDAKEEIFFGGDPEEILLNNFGLEPDYIFELIL